MSSFIEKYKGRLLVFGSTMFFYLMTVLVKFITEGGRIPGTQVSFFRFLIGFILVNLTLVKSGYGNKLKMINKKAVLARAILCSLSIILFFIVIQYATVTKGNIYNLTYPVFVVIFGPFFLSDEKWSLQNWLGVIVSFAGLFLISGLAFGHFSWVDSLGILMGMVSGFAIISLRKARLTDSPDTILFYLMFFGIIMTVLPFGHSFVFPNLKEWMFIIGMGTFSYLGQYTLTHGFKYVKAVEGSLISESRIFISAILGILFLGEPFSYAVLFGGVLIFLGITIVSLQKK